jgi:O-antigen ligase
MELWIPLALGMALAPDASFLRRWLWCSAALVMAASVVMAASRGGLLAVAVQVTVLAIATAALHGRRRAVVGLVGGVVALAGFLWYVGSADLLERFTPIGNPGSATLEEVSGHRFEAWSGSLQIFREHWLLGTGLDTFEPHFRGMRQYYTDKVWTHAHNDFLQFVAETGVVGVALGLWLVIAAAREILRNLRRTAQTATGAMLIGLGCACLGFMVHGWLDFNFHVPANAAGFAVLAAIAARRGWDED